MQVTPGYFVCYLSKIEIKKKLFQSVFVVKSYSDWMQQPAVDPVDCINAVIENITSHCRNATVCGRLQLICSIE